jgi:hypothetical protein
LQKYGWRYGCISGLNKKYLFIFFRYLVRLKIFTMKSLFVFCFFLMCLVFAQFTQAQTVDEVVDKYLAAIGGKEKIAALKSVKMDGSLNVQGFDISVVTTVLNGVGSRTDISVPGMGEGYQIMTPTKGWRFMPFQGDSGPVDATEDQVKSGQVSLDIQSPFFNYKEKGHTVELLGKENANGKECYKLKLTTKQGKTSTVYLDATTYYRIKTVTKASINGEETDVEAVYSDFKTTPEGYVFAYSQTTPQGIITYSAITINPPVDENIFKAN